MPSKTPPYSYEHIVFNQAAFPFSVFIIPDSATLPHWHNHTEIIYAKQGSIDVYVNGTHYPCHENDILLVPGNSLHSIIPDNPATYAAIVIGDDLLKDLLFDLHFSSIIKPLTDGYFFSPYYLTRLNPIHTHLLKNIRNLISESTSTNPHRELFIKIEICHFFATLARFNPSLFSVPEIHSTSHTANMKTAIEFLTNHYSEKITINSMTDLMNMSEQHFSRLFKAYTGKTFIEYLTLFRLEKANKLLLKSDLPITQIPELTGFCNPNYFSRVYKNNYGSSPSVSRKLYLTEKTTDHITDK